MGFNEFLSSIFGNKSTRDMKEIKPWVEKIKAAYPEIEALDNDALRAKTEELKKYIRESATDERAKVEELKASIESTELEDREEVFAQIDKIEKEILEKYEKALEEVLPVAFSIVKATAKRFTENEEIVVTATEFDRHLAATKDFVRIEGDKAIYQNHWNAGGNDTVWNMIHYDVQLFGGVVLHKGKIAEMATGEGKTLVATLPVFLNATTGSGSSSSSNSLNFFLKCPLILERFPIPINSPGSNEAKSFDSYISSFCVLMVTLELRPPPLLPELVDFFSFSYFPKKRG